MPSKPCKNWELWKQLQHLWRQLQKVSFTALAYRALSRVAVQVIKKLKEGNERLRTAVNEWKQAHDDLNVAWDNYEARLKGGEALLERWTEWEKEIQNRFK